MENQVETTQVETTEQVDNSTNPNTETNVEHEALTVDMVQKMIQSETDKVRTEYTKKLKAKEKEIEDVKKSSMSEQEKLDYENKTLQEQLQARENDLLEKVKAFERSQIELEAVKLLDASEIPIEFKQFLVADDLETTTSNIELFKQTFNEAVGKEIGERIKGTYKEQKTTIGNATLSKEEWLNLPYKERIKTNYK